MKRILKSIGLAAAFVALVAGGALAQSWPQKPVTFVVPFPAGGNTDTMARLASEFLTKRLGRNFVVENRPTGGGTLAGLRIPKAKLQDARHS